MSLHPLVETAIDSQGIRDVLLTDVTGFAEVKNLSRVVEQLDPETLRDARDAVAMAVPTRTQIAARSHLHALLTHQIEHSTQPVRIRDQRFPTD